MRKARPSSWRSSSSQVKRRAKSRTEALRRRARNRRPRARSLPARSRPHHLQQPSLPRLRQDPLRRRHLHPMRRHLRQRPNLQHHRRHLRRPSLLFRHPPRRNPLRRPLRRQSPPFLRQQRPRLLLPRRQPAAQCARNDGKDIPARHRQAHPSSTMRCPRREPRQLRPRISHLAAPSKCRPPHRTAPRRRRHPQLRLRASLSARVVRAHCRQAHHSTERFHRTPRQPPPFPAHPTPRRRPVGCKMRRRPSHRPSAVRLPSQHRFRPFRRRPH